MSDATAYERLNARWYVYRLIDPRTDRPFYIGKGTGKRISDHERDLRRLKKVWQAKGLSGRVLPVWAKYRRIEEIWDAGLQVGQEYVAYFWDREAALAFEQALILEARETLTNKFYGRGGQ